MRWRFLRACLALSAVLGFGQVAQAVTYTALGASDAVGVGASDFVDPGPSPAKGYVPQVHSYLQTRTGDSWTLSNRGVSGYTAVDIAANTLAPAVADAPKVVTLYVGANDVLHIAGVVAAGNDYASAATLPDKLNRFASNYTAIITQLKTVPGIVIVTGNVPPMGDMPAASAPPFNLNAIQRAQVNSLCEALNTIISNVAGANSVPVLDFYNDPNSVDDAFLSDGFHPNDAGHTGIADAFAGELNLALPDGESLIVTSMADDLTDDTATTLREAITYAEAHAGADTITFDATVFDPLGSSVIELESALPHLTTDTTITGPGTDALTLQTSLAAVTFFSLLHVQSGTVTVSGLALAGGEDTNGGAIYNNGTLSVQNCVFGYNFADGGGAIYNEAAGASLTVNNCFFVGNEASNGGAIVNSGGSTLTVKNSAFAGNYASSFGGAIYSNGPLTLENSTFFLNEVDGDETAAAVESDDSATITHCTFGGNFASDPSSVSAIASWGPTGAVTIKHVLFDDDSAPSVGALSGGALTSLGYNLSSDDGSGLLVATGDIINTASQLDFLAYNGGLTPTCALPAASPAIDAGDPAFTSPPATDQRGAGFPRVQRGRIDIGAYEAFNTPPVADDQAVNTDEETSINITLGASDPDVVDTLTYHITQLPSHGTLANADGSAIVGNAPTTNVVKYTPALNYPLGAPPATGPDSFKFKANDGADDSNEATVSVTVNAICDVPISVGDSYATAQNQTLTVNAPGVLGNDTEPDGETLHAIKVTDPSHGTLTLNDNGGFVYIPDTDYDGPDSFTYKASDGALEGNTVTVNIQVSSPLKITYFSPTAGAPGTTVTIVGFDFVGTVGVQLNGVVVGPADIVSIAPTKIVFKVPAGATTGKIRVNNTTAARTSVNPFMVSPTISSFSPASGAPGTIVAVNGTNLGTPGAIVKIGGITAQIQSFSATQLRIVVPSNAVSGPITVTNNGGTATSATNFLLASKITSFSPAGGAEGATVTINGSGFTGSTDVLFNGQSVGAGNFSVVSNTKITAIVPANATKGFISVATPAGTVQSATPFTVAPIVTNVVPTSGKKQSRVTITGRNLETATVKIGTVAQVITKAADRTATSLTFTVPNTTTSGTIAVTNAGGSTTAGTFTVLP